MTLVSSRGMAPWNSNGKIGSGGAKCERGMKKRPFSHCRYCIPIHQAALLYRALSLALAGLSCLFCYAALLYSVHRCRQEFVLGHFWGAVRSPRKVRADPRPQVHFGCTKSPESASIKATVFWRLLSRFDSVFGVLPILFSWDAWLCLWVYHSFILRACMHILLLLCVYHVHFIIGPQKWCVPFADRRLMCM